MTGVGIAFDGYHDVVHGISFLGGYLIRRYSLGGIALNNVTIRRLKDYHRESRITAEI